MKLNLCSFPELAAGKILEVGFTWRFMGSYKWGYTSDNYTYNPIRGLISPLITTHEPPSRVEALREAWFHDINPWKDHGGSDSNTKLSAVNYNIV